MNIDDIRDLCDEVERLLAALKALDACLDFGTPFRPGDTGPRNPDKLNAAFKLARAALEER